MPHHTNLYISVSISEISPSDQSHVGIRIIAPQASVNTAMIAAVMAPNVTNGTEHHRFFFVLRHYKRAEEHEDPD